MDTLPPKPQESATPEKVDHDRDRRVPHISQRQSYRGSRYSSRSPDSRSAYSRRSPPRRGGDSYVASHYDRRRDGDFYRRGFDDRDRGRRERSRDRSLPRRRESSRDYDRGRRGFERDRHYDRYRDSSRRGYSPHRDRRSRSPLRRKTPPPSIRRRSRSPPYRSPPRKRMRVDSRSSPNRGHTTDERARSRSQIRRSNSKSSTGREQEKTHLTLSAISKDENQTSSIPDEPRDSKIASPAQPCPGQQDSTTTTQCESTPTLLPTSGEPRTDKRGEDEQLAAETRRTAEGVNSRDRSLSPPRQVRRPPQSPPRGPRVHHRSSNPPTGPASSYPSGPRGQRRVNPPFLPTHSNLPHPVPSTPVDERPPTPLEYKIPVMKPPPSLMPELDVEMAKLQAHRNRLATEHVQLARELRRALHELDMAAIDLRAAELRRRVADAQHEKARNGVLGVDYVPSVEGSTI